MYDYVLKQKHTMCTVITHYNSLTWYNLQSYYIANYIKILFIVWFWIFNYNITDDITDDQIFIYNSHY